MWVWQLCIVGDWNIMQSGYIGGVWYFLHYGHTHWPLSLGNVYRLLDDSSSFLDRELVIQLKGVACYKSTRIPLPSAHAASVFSSISQHSQKIILARWLLSLLISPTPNISRDFLRIIGNVRHTFAAHKTALPEPAPPPDNRSPRPLKC